MKLTRIFSKIAIIVLFISIMFFYSCEGNRMSPETGTVGLYFTDDMSQFRQVITSIEKIEIINTDTGARCDLLDVSTTIDIAKSSDVLLLANETQCPSGLYNQIHIEFNKSVQLMSAPTPTTSGIVSFCSLASYKDEANESHPLQCSGPVCTLDIGALFTIIATENNKLALDFNLKNFDVVNFGDLSTCAVTMSVLARTTEEVIALGRPEAIIGLISDLTFTNHTFSFIRQNASITIDYSEITTDQQPHLDTVLQIAQNDGLTLNILSSDVMSSGTVTAANILVNIQGTASNLNILSNTFTLAFQGTQITVDYSNTDANGTLVNGAWVDVRIYGYDGTNYLALDPSFNVISGIREILSIRKYSSLTDAVNEIGAAQVTLVIDALTILKLNTIIPSNISTIVEYPGIIDLNSYKLIINGPFSAGLYKVFNAGNVTFANGSVQEVYPEWWGAKSDNTTDCATAISNAINAFDPNVGGIVKLSPGYYKKSTAITLKDKVILIGSGRLTTNIVNTANTDGIVMEGKTPPARGGGIKDLTITHDGSDVTNAGILFDLNQGYAHGLFSNLQIFGFGYGIRGYDEVWECEFVDIRSTSAQIVAFSFIGTNQTTGDNLLRKLYSDNPGRGGTTGQAFVFTQAMIKSVMLDCTIGNTSSADTQAAFGTGVIGLTIIGGNIEGFTLASGNAAISLTGTALISVENVAIASVNGPIAGSAAIFKVANEAILSVEFCAQLNTPSGILYSLQIAEGSTAKIFQVGNRFISAFDNNGGTIYDKTVFGL